MRNRARNRATLLLALAMSWIALAPPSVAGQEPGGEVAEAPEVVAVPNPEESVPHPAVGDSLAAALAEAGPSGAGRADLAQQVEVEIHHGIDVSRHSGAVDWPVIASHGFSFAVVKATEGVDLKDSAFDSHWPAIHQAGLRRGAYHFYVTEDDPIAQAEFFLSTVPFASGDLVPVVDIELIGHNTQPGLADRLQKFLDHVESSLGVKPMIYTSPTFWNRHLTDDFGGYPLWIAEYEVSAPVLPKGWREWHLWQSRGDATIEGVEKGADLNLGNPRWDSIPALLIP